MNEQEVSEEIKEELKNTHLKTLIAIKAVLRGKFITIQTYLKKQEKHQISNLTLYLQYEKKKNKSSKVSRRSEITKIRAEMKRNEGGNSKDQ